MAPCIEIVRAIASDAYRTNGVNAMKEALDIVSTATGSLATYTGTEEENAGYWYLFNVWESLQDHQALIDDKEDYPKLKDSLFKAASGLSYLNHVTISPHEPYDVLNAPFTRLIIWTLKEEADRKEFTKSVDAILAEVYSWEGVYKGGRGDIVEDDKKIAIIAGANTPEEFDKAFFGSAKVRQLLAEMRKLGAYEIKHVRLTRYVNPKPKV